MIPYKKCFKYLGIISLAAVITVIVCSFGVTNQTERWEHTLVCTCDYAHLAATEKKLNSLGREGWEVISAVSWNLNSPDDLVFTLKRRAR